MLTTYCLLPAYYYLLLLLLRTTYSLLETTYLLTILPAFPPTYLLTYLATSSYNLPHTSYYILPGLLPTYT